MISFAHSRMRHHLVGIDSWVVNAFITVMDVDILHFIHSHARVEPLFCYAKQVRTKMFLEGYP
jgi:hypothetical protein